MLRLTGHRPIESCHTCTFVFFYFYPIFIIDSQFTQFGIELMGDRDLESVDPQADVEVIALAAHALSELQLFPKHVSVRVGL